MELMDTKWCKECARLVPVDLFPWARTGKRLPRRGPRCIRCKREYDNNRSREYRARTGTRLSARRHKLTDQQYDQMLADQDGHCAFPGCMTTDLQIDHDKSCCPGQFSCGKCVRALLCRKHNMGLGAFDDDPAQLTLAIEFLLKHRS